MHSEARVVLKQFGGRCFMQFMRFGTVRSSEDVISGILNCVCPECGGRMGERGQEFRCQGECLTDWRPTWEQASAEFGMRSKKGSKDPAWPRLPEEAAPTQEAELTPLPE
jgi:hypothetical protein